MDFLVGLFDPNVTEQEDMPEILPPEVEVGNIEYKLKLVGTSDSRLEHLTTQMKWRLKEGDGEAIYEIGVADNGLLAGLTDDDYFATMGTLEKMATKLGATISVLREKFVHNSGDETKRVAEVLVRRVPENQQFIDLRLAVLGNVDAGKSTLLGVLTQGELDDGRGRARLNLFRHLHEIQTGRTSSISHEVIGFTSSGEVLNYADSRTVEEICDNATKLITLMDLCGHHKYLKTTVFCLTGNAPDFAMLVVSANKGLAGTTREHLGFALALDVPVFCVVTKVDMCHPQQVARTVRQLEHSLKGPGCKKVPFRVADRDDAITAAAQFPSQSICPIFTVSSVTGIGLRLLTDFLNAVPPLQNKKDLEQQLAESAEHRIDEVYRVGSVGLVASGTLLRGVVTEGARLLLGPTDTGTFHPVRVNGIHRHGLPCRTATAGQAASFCLGHFQLFPLRKGMVLLSPDINPVVCLQFEADVFLLYHTHRFIAEGFQTVVHVDNVRQTAKIVEILNKPCLRSNAKARVVFRFINRPEYLRIGARLIFREGRTKGMGEVRAIYAYQHQPFGS